jgi:hypothetical protein
MMPTERNIWIELQVQGLVPLRIVEIEEAVVVRAGIRAIAGADAAVVDLAVQPLRCVITRVGRTDRLAGRSIALLARHGHEFHFDIGEVTFVITLDTNPVLSSSDRRLVFSYSAMLFSAWQAITQASQPVQRSRSMTMPHE